MWQTQILPQQRDTNTFPVSFAQQRLWFLDQLEPGSSTYNVASAYRLTGPLDVTILEQCFNKVVQRHEALRTTFTVVDEQPIQVIAPSQILRSEIVDLQKLPQAERESKAHCLASEEAQRPFDLTQGPLLRTTLLQLDQEEYILLLTIHHIVFDGWSLIILLQELSALYEACTRGKSPILPKLPIQYADFTVWQREWLQGEVLERQLDYWKQQLEGAPSALELPTDRPRPTVQTFRGMSQKMLLSKRLLEQLKQLSLQEGTTLFMTLLAAFKVLLHRYTEQEDIVVGIPIANRNRAEIEHLIGFFVNTLVLRTDLSANPTFRELLGRVREVALGAYDHQDLPFEKLVEELHPQRDLSRTPLFQVFFNMLNRDQNQLELDGVTIEPIIPLETDSKFDLTLYAREQKNEGIHFDLEYNADLFETPIIIRMLGHYRTLLEGIVVNPDQRFRELPLLTAAEREQLLVEWNDTSRKYPKDKSIQELFENQVERTPEATAIIFGEEDLSYRELNAKANQVAHYLKKRGVAEEVLVGICLERSLEMVVGLLGILKAGGAYLPLDPNYPAERLAFMLTDAQAPVLLTQEKLLDKIPGHQAETICIDQEWGQIEKESQENPESGIAGENIAYAIYTSGSTGKPKGVLGLHQGAINRFEWMWERYPFEAGEVCCQKTTLNFVDSIWEIFGPLLKGVPIVIISDEAVKDPSRLVEELAKYEVSRIVLVPSLLRAMLETNPNIATKLKKLKIWATSGEAISKELAERFQAAMRQSRLINLYGSSEVSADVTYYEIGVMEEEERSIPIGRPIANTQIYLLDGEMKPVPIGGEGEIYLGGEGLARGYLNRAELTKEKFVANPYREGERLYRTGDIGRYRGDGQIEYVGRVDHQVKIRGNRVEIGEVEVVLSQYEGVAEVVIVVQEDTSGDNYLAAYIVPDTGITLDISELRNFLRQTLPDYMMPLAFVILEALPLTPNGKVNRQALPVPDQTRPDVESRFVAPRTEIEEQMVKIWTEILGLERVGVYDNFFDLGGHSLLATQVIFQLTDAFHVKIHLRALFETPTIAGLAKQVETVSRILAEEGSANGKLDNREEIVL